uniref:F22G5.2 n=1 Tax=Arabidopsis thaliana TaxID=3702 RepID=Q9LNY3_ARATH|nr:F22G5.2 [Arabidopsis thaliana]
MKTLHNHTITIHRKIQSWEKSKLKRVDTQHNDHNNFINSYSLTHSCSLIHSYSCRTPCCPKCFESKVNKTNLLCLFTNTIVNEVIRRLELHRGATSTVRICHFSYFSLID